MDRKKKGLRFILTNIFVFTMLINLIGAGFNSYAAETVSSSKIVSKKSVSVRKTGVVVADNSEPEVGDYTYIIEFRRNLDELSNKLGNYNLSYEEEMKLRAEVQEKETKWKNELKPLKERVESLNTSDKVGIRIGDFLFVEEKGISFSYIINKYPSLKEITSTQSKYSSEANRQDGEEVIENKIELYYGVHWKWEDKYYYYDSDDKITSNAKFEPMVNYYFAGGGNYWANSEDAYGLRFYHKKQGYTETSHDPDYPTRKPEDSTQKAFWYYEQKIKSEDGKIKNAEYPDADMKAVANSDMICSWKWGEDYTDFIGSNVALNFYSGTKNTLMFSNNYTVDGTGKTISEFAPNNYTSNETYDMPGYDGIKDDVKGLYKGWHWSYNDSPDMLQKYFYSNTSFIVYQSMNFYAHVNVYFKKYDEDRYYYSNLQREQKFAEVIKSLQNMSDFPVQSDEEGYHWYIVKTANKDYSQNPVLLNDDAEVDEDVILEYRSDASIPPRNPEPSPDPQPGSAPKPEPPISNEPPGVTQPEIPATPVPESPTVPSTETKEEPKETPKEEPKEAPKENPIEKPNETPRVIPEEPQSIPSEPDRPETPDTTPVEEITTPETPLSDFPTYPIDNFPDPESPDSPDEFVAVDEDGTPLGKYVKKTRPDGEKEYVIEDDFTPQGSLPKVIESENIALPKTGGIPGWIYIVSGNALLIFGLYKLKEIIKE